MAHSGAFGDAFPFFFPEASPEDPEKKFRSRLPYFSSARCFLYGTKIEMPYRDSGPNFWLFFFSLIEQLRFTLGFITFFLVTVKQPLSAREPSGLNLPLPFTLFKNMY